MCWNVRRLWCKSVGSCSVIEGEAVAGLCTIQIAVELGLANVRLVGDNNDVIKSLFQVL